MLPGVLVMKCQIIPLAGSPQVAPLEADRIEPLLGAESSALLDTGLLRQLVASMSSPLNVLFPERVSENVKPFHETFEHYGIDGRVFLTTKPNRSFSIVREIACSPTIGVDVSSEGSLAAALSAGVPASRIEATGPKDQGYLSLAQSTSFWYTSRPEILPNQRDPDESKIATTFVQSHGPRQPEIVS
jgi:hypothetical protein